jgi:hypothetical protein
VTTNSRVVRIALILALAAMTLSSAALAVAAPGRGGTHGTTGATISFAPTQVVVGSDYRVNGSGFRPNTWVTVGAHYSDTTWWNSQLSDAQGNISLPFTATRTGSIYHEAKEQGNNGRLRLVTSATLTVTAAP